jgi:hypothetical protein
VLFGSQYESDPRSTSIPTIRDRVVETAATLVLEPIFEADFDDAAYGYRPKRGALDGPAAHVFGNETGEPIASIKTAWKATCRRANITGLHFHDLRREFASRVRETPGNSDHEVRDLLGHANISTTSRYLGSTPETRERAMHRFEQHQNASKENSHTKEGCDNAGTPLSTEAEAPEVTAGKRVS